MALVVTIFHPTEVCFTLGKRQGFINMLYSDSTFHPLLIPVNLFCTMLTTCPYLVQDPISTGNSSSSSTAMLPLAGTSS